MWHIVTVYIYMSLFNDLKFSKGKNNNHNILFGILNKHFVVGLSESWSWSSSVVNLPATCYLFPHVPSLKGLRAENHAGREADFANLDQNPLLLDHGRHLPVLASTSHRWTYASAHESKMCPPLLVLTTFMWLDSFFFPFDINAVSFGPALFESPSGFTLIGEWIPSENPCCIWLCALFLGWNSMVNQHFTT